jgi:hypothetical protein
MISQVIIMPTKNDGKIANSSSGSKGTTKLLLEKKLMGGETGKKFNPINGRRQTTGAAICMFFTPAPAHCQSRVIPIYFTISLTVLP